MRNTGSDVSQNFLVFAFTIQVTTFKQVGNFLPNGDNTFDFAALSSEQAGRHNKVNILSVHVNGDLLRVGISLLGDRLQH